MKPKEKIKEMEKEDVGSPIAKKIWRNQKVHDEMMKWKKKDIIDFFIEKEDEHKQALADVKELIENFKGKNYTDMEIWEDMKKEILKELEE